MHIKNTDPLDDVLETLDRCLDTPTEIRDKKIYCTDWSIVISPEINSLDDHSAVVYFNIECPDWDEPLFECCSGLGKDQKTAIGTAVGSFMFAFMDGIAAMENDLDPISIESEFAGHMHKWKAYKSNIVGMGENADPEFKRYWDMLKDGITKRLGNQRMCYVKVYACKSVGADGKESVTGECRVNNVPSNELSAIVYNIASEFKVHNFCSQKMFFFIRQDSQTLLPYPYRMNKIPALREKVITALEMFDKCETEEQFNELPGNMAEAMQDGLLAEECYSFLPEICAENALSEMLFSEQLQFAIGDKEPVVVYKTQLAEFYPLGNIMFSIFDSGYFGERTNDLYHKLISVSAIAGVVMQRRAEGKSLEGLKMTALLFNTSPGFELR